jgi:hypothetical protein
LCLEVKQPRHNHGHRESQLPSRASQEGHEGRVITSMRRQYKPVPRSNKGRSESKTYPRHYPYHYTVRRVGLPAPAPPNALEGTHKDGWVAKYTQVDGQLQASFALQDEVEFMRCYPDLVLILHTNQIGTTCPFSISAAVFQ